MKCCNNSNENGNSRKNKHNGHMSHLWMMILCCGAPIIILLILPLIGSFVPGAGSVLRRIVPFLCPLMMLFMLPMMLKGGKSDNKSENCNHQNEVKSTEKLIEQ